MANSYKHEIDYGDPSYSDHFIKIVQCFISYFWKVWSSSNFYI